jgi:tetratricopeptide (TPR) repeat protein
VVESALARDANARLPLATAALQRNAAWSAFARGWAAAAANDAALARMELAHLGKIAEEPPGAEEVPHMREYLDILAALLNARIAEHDGELEQAIALAGKAAALQDSLAVDFGPPLAVKPPHEYTGELLLKAGRADAGLAEFKKALQATPRRAPSLLGLARANRALGNAAAAQQAYGELAGIWASADPGLADLAEVRGGARPGPRGFRSLARARRPRPA